jgi:D-tyrosyl-tRNA(Tyr) deacylase
MGSYTERYDLSSAIGVGFLGYVLTMRQMRSVVQRVRYAKVSVDGELISNIARGLCVLVAVGVDDTSSDVGYMAAKLAGLRVFEDSAGKMNLSLRDVAGEMMLVSQFTLFGDARGGNRPSFTSAATADIARQYFEELAEMLAASLGCPVKTGRFQAHMDLELANDGPVTILIDSKKVF